MLLAKNFTQNQEVSFLIYQKSDQHHMKSLLRNIQHQKRLYMLQWKENMKDDILSIEQHSDADGWLRNEKKCFLFYFKNNSYICKIHGLSNIWKRWMRKEMQQLKHLFKEFFKNHVHHVNEFWTENEKQNSSVVIAEIFSRSRMFRKNQLIHQINQNGRQLVRTAERKLLFITRSKNTLRSLPQGWIATKMNLSILMIYGLYGTWHMALAS